MGKTETDWIKNIKKGSETELNSLYTQFREEFIAWSQVMFKLNSDEAADIFQDVVITFYWNVKKDKLTALTSSIKTYLFAIGKNLALKKLNKDKRLVVDNSVIDFSAIDELDELPMEHTDRQLLIARLFKQLGEPCRLILKLFYFDHFTMDSIAQRLEYKNEHVVKTQKLRCLQKLREMFDYQALQKEDI